MTAADFHAARERYPIAEQYRIHETATADARKPGQDFINFVINAVSRFHITPTTCDLFQCFFGEPYNNAHTSGRVREPACAQ